jgi:argininosuccinate lyase
MPSLQRPTLGEITSRPSRFLIAPVIAAIFAMVQANAADTLDTACKTTAECQAQVAKIQGVVKGDATSALASRKTRSTGLAASTWHRRW